MRQHLFYTSPNLFADDNINVTHQLKFVLERVENIVGKKENAGHQHFLLYRQWFQKLVFVNTLPHDAAL